MAGLTLERLDGEFAICRLAPGAEVTLPATAALHSVIRTGHETTVVCPAPDAPAGAKVEQPWTALRVAGTLDFSLTGVLAGLTAPLGSAGVSVFAISTYDTDYLLVPSGDVGAATDALRSAGYEL